MRVWTRLRGWGIIIGLGAVAALATPALTQEDARVAALAGLEPGLWQLRNLDDPRVSHPPICIGDARLLMQIQHRNSPCSRLVVGNEANAVTVHYTCPDGGYGQTFLRVETSRLVQIDTQGISGNVPFAYRAEARRAGECDGGRRGGGR